jgi:phosphatidylserine/phosphatidylglycerophosphate/cardiolipin synthase-like enzyme
MTSLERRLRQIEAQLSPRAKGPTLADILRAAEERARERIRLGLPRDDAIPPESDNPWAQRYRQACIRAQQARARLQDVAPGPW